MNSFITKLIYYLINWLITLVSCLYCQHLTRRRYRSTSDCFLRYNSVMYLYAPIVIHYRGQGHWKAKKGNSCHKGSWWMTRISSLFHLLQSSDEKLKNKNIEGNFTEALTSTKYNRKRRIWQLMRLFFLSWTKVSKLNFGKHRIGMQERGCML